MVVTILNRDNKLVFRLSPFFVALFAFTFSIGGRCMSLPLTDCSA